MEVERNFRANIESITFRSKKCYYCDNDWEHELHIEPIEGETKELTGKLVEIFVCEECKGNKTEPYKNRIRYDSSEQKIIDKKSTLIVTDDGEVIRTHDSLSETMKKEGED